MNCQYRNQILDQKGIQYPKGIRYPNQIRCRDRIRYRNWIRYGNGIRYWKRIRYGKGIRDRNRTWYRKGTNRKSLRNEWPQWALGTDRFPKNWPFFERPHFFHTWETSFHRFPDVWEYFFLSIENKWKLEYVCLFYCIGGK